MDLKIGELAEATGTTAPAVRYYEEIGLLPRPDRRGVQRRYGDDDIRRLTFVRRCRDLGFPIDQVRTLLTLTQDTEGFCIQARDMAAAHLVSVRAKLEELHALERSIVGLIDAADAVCGGGPGAECIVLEGLAEPAHR